MEEQITLHERITATSADIIHGIPYLCARLFSKAKLYIDRYNISQKSQCLTKINVFFASKVLLKMIHTIP